MIKLQISKFDEKKTEIYSLIKITGIKDHAIDSYVKVGDYYPIIKRDGSYCILHINNRDKKLGLDYRIFAWSRPDRVYSDMQKYATFDIIGVCKYDCAKGNVYLEGEEYIVELV